MKRALLLVVASSFALVACNQQGGMNGAQEQHEGTDIGIQTSWIDKGVVPGNDFFSYADGTWVKNTPNSPDRSRIGAFWMADQLREKNTREMFDQILKSNPTTGNDGLIAAYYKAFFNTDAIDHAGLAPAKADLNRFQASPTSTS